MYYLIKILKQKIPYSVKGLQLISLNFKQLQNLIKFL